MSKHPQNVPVLVDSDLWATNILPEGILEKWLRRPGEFVETGQPLAMVRIEDALHELLAPANGRLVIDRKNDSVIEPGAMIGHIEGQSP